MLGNWNWVRWLVLDIPLNISMHTFSTSLNFRLEWGVLLNPPIFPPNYALEYSIPWYHAHRTQQSQPPLDSKVLLSLFWSVEYEYFVTDLSALSSLLNLLGLKSFLKELRHFSYSVIGIGTGGLEPPPHFPGRGSRRRSLPPPPLLGSHISQDPARIPLLSLTQFHGTDS